MPYPGYAKIFKKILRFPIKLYQSLRLSTNNGNLVIFKKFFVFVLTFGIFRILSIFFEILNDK